MRTVNKAWVKDMGRNWSGHNFAVSTERHDGIVYTANSPEEAIKKYEADRRCTVESIVIE